MLKKYVLSEKINKIFKLCKEKRLVRVHIEKCGWIYIFNSDFNKLELCGISHSGERKKIRRSVLHHSCSRIEVFINNEQDCYITKIVEL